MSTHASSSRAAVAVLVASLACAPGLAAAAPLSPLDTGLFAFPGAFDHPFSAYSASVALADRWLGADPCGNPAVERAQGMRVTPALLRVSRQDLRAANRNYDETPMFIDAAGLSAVLAAPFGLAASLYAAQPVLRHEDNAFTRGRGTIDPVPPAVIQSHSTGREVRAGFGLARAAGPVRLGAAIEWSRRDDAYEALEESGSPDAGLRRLEFSGDGVGFQLGARWAPSERLAIAAAARRLPALDLEGEQRLELFSGDSLAAISARRTAAWEGGLSARVVASEGLALLASLGGRSRQEWEGLGVAAGPYLHAALALDFDLPESDWSLRLGLGHEQQTDVPEPRANSIALGAGWDLQGLIVDFGVVRRAFRRDGSPTSYDDRILITARVDF